MQRFHDLASSRHGWKVVSQKAFESTERDWKGSLGARYPPWTFRSLEQAVEVSRPGDTILLEPSEEPYLAESLVISHPLRILGGFYHLSYESKERNSVSEQGLGDVSKQPTSNAPLANVSKEGNRFFKTADASSLMARISCSSSVSPAFIIRASSRLANLQISNNGAGGCIVHARGALAIDGCDLQCNSEGLSHLVSPLVTWAGSMNHHYGASDSFLQRYSTKQSALVVMSTSLVGGNKSVRLLGDGGLLKHVRVIYEAHKTLFYFEVGSMHDSKSDKAECTIETTGNSNVSDFNRQPTWVQSGISAEVQFDPLALQHAVANHSYLLSSSIKSTEDCASNSDDDLDRKAFAWKKQRTIELGKESSSSTVLQSS